MVIQTTGGSIGVQRAAQFLKASRTVPSMAMKVQ